MARKAAYVALIAGLGVGGASVAFFDAAEARQKLACDDYWFEQSEWQRPDMRFEFVQYKSLSALRSALRRIDRAAVRQARQAGRNIYAFSEIDLTANLTRVHIVDPAVLHDPCMIGHEIGHGLKGRWHPNQN